MKNVRKYQTPINGNLEVQIHFQEDEFDGEVGKWQDVLINGDPEGLRSLAKVLIEIADKNQEAMDELPIGAREHVHLRPKFDLSNNSVQLIIGRLDGKGSGTFHDGFIPRQC